MGFFYSGSWAVHTPPASDRGDGSYGWALPKPTGRDYYTDTMAPEDLLVDPEDIDLTPDKVQYGDSLWQDISDVEDIGWYPVTSNSLVTDWYLKSIPLDPGWYILPGSY